VLEGVILAGGAGERFWPLSCPGRPKQLLTLCGNESLLQATYQRLRVRLEAPAIRVVTGAGLVPAIRAQLPEIPGACIVPEVVGRNTAPALAVAAALGSREGKDPIQIVVPSDHWIPATADFWESVDRAVRLASAPDRPLVTFGIPIARPETGYGYIERGDARPEVPDTWEVRRFKEKPDAATAAAYQEAGGYFWNSGIFIWHARSILDEIDRSMPELGALVRPLQTADDATLGLDEVFRRAPSQSIDFGVLERSERVAVVRAGFAWSDLGTWRSWGELAEHDGRGNAVRGDVLSIETDDCVLFADQGLVATLGIRDLIVVRTADTTMVLPKERSQEVRRILRALRSKEG